MLEKTLESPLDYKEIQPVHPKGNQSWIFIGRTHAEAETLKPWPPDKKNWLIGKHPYAGRDLKQGKKGLTEDEMVRWHHWLDGQSLGSGNWWWTGKPGVLQSMGSHRVGQDWVTELNWTEQCTLSATLWGMSPPKEWSDFIEIVELSTYMLLTWLSDIMSFDFMKFASRTFHWGG